VIFMLFVVFYSKTKQNDEILDKIFIFSIIGNHNRIKNERYVKGMGGEIAKNL